MAVEGLTPASPPSRVVMRVRYSAWLNGDLGREITSHVKAALKDQAGLRLDRLPGGLVVEADEAPGVLVEAVMRAATVAEAAIAKIHPVFVHEMGGVWAGAYTVIAPKHEVVA
jgi:hypothetical protein